MTIQIEALLAGFFGTIILGFLVIPILKKFKIGQVVRNDGPQSHLKKSGTPTMGGIIMLMVILAVSLVIATKYLVDRDKNVKYNTNLQGIISQKGIVVQDIEPYEVGIVKLNGEEWSAISKDKVKIEKGKIVEVIQIEGVKLIVREVSNINLDLDNNKDDTDSISREIDIKIKTSE